MCSTVRVPHFRSQLRSPRFFEVSVTGGGGAAVAPYTPPPILSPMRSGSGLFWQITRALSQSSQVTFFTFFFIELQYNPVQSLLFFFYNIIHVSSWTLLFDAFKGGFIAGEKRVNSAGGVAERARSGGVRLPRRKKATTACARARLVSFLSEPQLCTLRHTADEAVVVARRGGAEVRRRPRFCARRSRPGSRNAFAYTHTHTLVDFLGPPPPRPHARFSHLTSPSFFVPSFLFILRRVVHKNFFAPLSHRLLLLRLAGWRQGCCERG